MHAKRILLGVALGAAMLIFTANDAQASNRMMRYLGIGWGEGYHAHCCCPGVDYGPVYPQIEAIPAIGQKPARSIQRASRPVPTRSVGLKK